MTTDVWRDPWMSPAELGALNSPLDRWTRVQQYRRRLATLAGEIRTLRGSLTAVDRVRVTSAEMVADRPMLAAELVALIETAAELLGLCQEGD
jgi:hypothetical protein